ncbi:Uncharacterized protein APZ42_004084 [Daphnia magna]|uniref:Uncharacterized protein n=1 Tax=Daphnia magna TaxID=35525 RepID=A0A0P6A9V9_9CRUS|nr:Uncharacterized protein APZ42_004084 [Daphnia magna]
MGFFFFVNHLEDNMDSGISQSFKRPRLILSQKHAYRISWGNITKLNNSINQNFLNKIQTICRRLVE